MCLIRGCRGLNPGSQGGLSTALLSAVVSAALTHSYGMDSSTGRSHFLVSLHSVHQHLYRRRLEVHVSVKGKDVSIVGKYLLPSGVKVLTDKSVTEQVVHIHDLKINQDGG